MTEMTKHPLRIAADGLRNAFARCGFELLDNGSYPELERTDLNIEVFHSPAPALKQVTTEDETISLRTSLLPFSLSKMKGTFPIKAVSFGKVFDGNDETYPARHRLEGVIASDMNLYDLGFLWNRIVTAAFGAGSQAAMKETTLGKTMTWSIETTLNDGRTFTLGYMGTVNWLAAALLGLEECRQKCFAFSIDVDDAACFLHGLKARSQLYDNRQSYLGNYNDSSISASETFEDRCRDTLRSMGYTEGFGMKIYPPGIYAKMNMIQDSWDLNNQGVLLKEPLGENTGLPTVLTPAIEQILSEKWAAGETEAKAFEVSHIFIPQRGAHPIEKLALSFGAYGENTDLKSFMNDVDELLTSVGNRNHFFLPNNMAIAYETGECRLILDEKMSYLGSNAGGISHKAEENFAIGTHAYMANLELMPIENKAKEEYGYIAPELRDN